MNATPVIIDTDPGLGEPGSDIDDGLAIALALRSPELDVLALTIVNGNVDVDTGTDVARRLTARLGDPALPVLRGADAPLCRSMAPLRELFETVLGGEASRSSSREPLGPTDKEHAADFLARAAAERPGEITVIAIGPMTNIALALRRHPAFVRDVRELVLMAGSATTYAQNITVVGDFNAYADPEALDIVVRCGAPIRMVGLDQTSRVMLSHADAAALRREGGDFAQWAADCADAWIGFLARAFPNRSEHQDACFLHDPLVVGTVIDPAICNWADAEVQVETRSELARGLVVADRGLALRPKGATNARVAVDTDLDRFHELFMTRLSSPAKDET